MDRIMRAVSFIKAMCTLQRSLDAAKSRARDVQPSTHKTIVIDFASPSHTNGDVASLIKAMKDAASGGGEIA